jgi:chromatin remodeling complex protein RSC6
MTHNEMVQPGAGRQQRKEAGKKPKTKDYRKKEKSGEFMSISPSKAETMLGEEREDFF